MPKNYVIQTAPFLVPTGDGKRIEEHFGLASLPSDQEQPGAYSVARMEAPPGWSEPAQCPDFDELTLMVSGRKQIEIDGESIVLEAGQSLLVHRGARVRYANPFEDAAVYWSVCIPAFTIEGARRESGGDDEHTRP